MAMFSEHAAHAPDRAERIRASLVSGGSMALAVGGAVAIVLTIIGLSALWPVWMVTISTIIVGLALILEGLAMAGRQMQMLSRTGSAIEQTELAGGLTTEFLAGCAGAVLGIIAIFGFYPIVLTACSVIVYGTALVFGSRSPLSESAGLSRAGTAASTFARTDIPPHAAVPSGDIGSPVARPMEQLGFLLSPAYGTQVMVGLACMTLGIVALAGIRPEVLTLVGLLTVGFVLFVSGTAVATRLVYGQTNRSQE